MENRVDKEKLFRVCDCYGLDEDRALYYTNVIVVPGYNNLINIFPLSVLKE